ncbi:pilus assembly protein PilP [Methylococcus geothermalis]|uniref:Pilus assembly protein PilP n=1 Tax=Methylococcus geothermalis TaxID=2681310 RepID=A0A858Q4Z2_9GAMM|nr:pilus assembly protein PilP [Methylococcus geothermalis]QJD28806.1 pilus assembly protein PilP [Methylococcus geothermalis]
MADAIVRVRCLAALAVASLLSGCAEDEMADLKIYVADVKARQKVNVEPLPEIKTVSPFLFNPAELHDPFKPIEKPDEAGATSADNGIRPDLSRPREQLEDYELDTLRMVGTVKMFGTLWALVRAADGTIHRVRVGNHMGRNFGRITRISDDGVELVEIVPDAQGGWLERNATLSLTEALGEKK